MKNEGNRNGETGEKRTKEKRKANMEMKEWNKESRKNRPSYKLERFLERKLNERDKKINNEGKKGKQDEHKNHFKRKKKTKTLKKSIFSWER